MIERNCQNYELKLNEEIGKSNENLTVKFDENLKIFGGNFCFINQKIDENFQSLDGKVVETRKIFTENFNKASSNSSRVFREMDLMLEVNKLKVDSLATELQLNNRHFGSSIKDNNQKLGNLTARIESLETNQLNTSNRIDELNSTSTACKDKWIEV